MIHHYTPSCLIKGMSCNPDRPYLIDISKAGLAIGRPKQPKWLVDWVVWKRSLGLSISRISSAIGVNSATTRLILRRLGLEIDRLHSVPEMRSGAVAEYQAGKNIPELAKSYGVGMSTIHRWIVAAGVKTRSISEAKVMSLAARPAGRERLGKKGAFHSRKSGAWIPTDSRYEYARLQQLEDDPCVLSFSRCSFRIKYLDGQSSRTYIPDFTVTLVGGETVVEEVKPAKWHSDQVVRTKAAAATAWLADLGISYRIIGETEIGSDLLSACAAGLAELVSPEYKAFASERRKASRRATQKAYIKRLRERDIDAFRAKMASYARACRGRKKAG